MKRSVTIAGHATSISLEPEFWAALDEITQEQEISLAGLIREIDEARAADRTNTYSLSSHIRVYILKHIQDKLPPQT